MMRTTQLMYKEVYLSAKMKMLQTREWGLPPNWRTWKCTCKKDQRLSMRCTRIRKTN